MSNNFASQGDVLDILFANRNKSYGAYLLRRNYPARLKTALGIMSGAMLVLSVGMQWKGKKETLAQTTDRERDSVHVISLQPEPLKPIVHPHVAPAQAAAPARRVAAPPVATDAQPLFRLVDQPKPIKTPTPITEAKPIAVGTSTEPGTVTGTGDRPAGPGGQGAGGTGAGTGEGSGGPYDANIVQMMPSFPGGDEALKRFFMSYLQTPEELEAGAQVKVTVRFVVGKDGSVSACVVDKSGGAVFDAEVLRVVRKMPRWKPGIQNGRPVAVYFMLPVTFMRPED